MARPPSFTLTRHILGGESDYGPGMFKRDDYATMANVVRAAEGAVVLSLNDTEEVRDIFHGLHFEEFNLTYSISKAEATQARELIISNREVRTSLL